MVVASGLAGAGISSPLCAQEKKPVANAAASRVDASAPPKLDRSGRKRVGKASFYGKKFAGKKMADGNRMNPQGNNAASRTLPLGTKAKVTNLETGQSATVRIQDRGPFVKGRIVDLSPATAGKIGIDDDKGVAKVEVAPLEVPPPDGNEKPAVEVNETKAAAGAKRREPDD